MTYIPTTKAEYATQGKSNSFIAAIDEGRMTAGQAAKAASKRLGIKVTARDIEPLCTEFHHAGLFDGKAKRVFFIDEARVNSLTINDIESARGLVYGWVLGFEKVFDGPYGRKRYVPLVKEVGAYDQAKVNRLGSKFHPLSKEEAEEAKAAIGKALPAFCTDWRMAR